MKASILVLSVVFAATQAAIQRSRDEEWLKFKLHYQRQFQNATEESYRKAIFEKNLEDIEEHNARYKRGLETYKMGVTRFTDQTLKEFQRFTSNKIIFDSREGTNIFKESAVNSRAIIPDSVDWRDRAIITPVKSQDSCGSCWAFAANGALEAHLKLYQNVTAILSEQQLIDCVNGSSCAGGSTPNAYKYIAKNGINYEGDYVYEAKDGACRYKSNKPKITIDGYEATSNGNEKLLMQVVATKGPVVTYIHAGNKFRELKSGVYYNPEGCNDKAVNHAVVVIGYGTEKGMDYWLIKNSWDTWWGEDGIGKMARNKDNHCLIGKWVYYPTL